MTFNEMEMNLPNGFHDAGLLGVHVDYVTRSAVLEMEIDVNGTGHDDPVLYQRARLRVADLGFAVIDPPHADNNFRPDGTPFWCSGYPIEPGRNPSPDAALAALPTSTRACRFFVVDWNALIYLAGGDFELEWAER